MVLEMDPEGWVKRKDTGSLRVGQKEGGALLGEVMTRGTGAARRQGCPRDTRLPRWSGGHRTMEVGIGG